MIWPFLPFCNAITYGIVQRNFEPAIDSQGSHQYSYGNSSKEHVPGATLVMKPTPILPNFDTGAAYGYYDDFVLGEMIPLDY